MILRRGGQALQFLPLRLTGCDFRSHSVVNLVSNIVLLRYTGTSNGVIAR